MSEERFSMVQECTDSYAVEPQPDGSAVITIMVPLRFVSLWLSKLSDLTTTESEIDEYAEFEFSEHQRDTTPHPPNERVVTSGERFEMAGECTNSYGVERQPNGDAEITMKIPKRFVSLWCVKLSDLYTTMKEIDKHIE